MGSRDDGDDPAALVQTRRPCPRVRGSEQDIVALIVPGGTGPQAQFDLIGLRAPDLTGPLRARESPKRLTYHATEVEAAGGRQEVVCPGVPIQPMGTVSGGPDGMVLRPPGTRNIVVLRFIWTTKSPSSVEFSS